MAVSVLWEYGRMNPAYRFLVDPWSMRGYESIHGAIAVTLGLSLAAIAAATSRKESTVAKSAIAIVVGTVALAAINDYVFDPGEELGFSTFVAILLAFVFAIIAMRLIQRSRMDKMPLGSKPASSLMFVVWLGSFAALSLLLILLSEATNISVSFGTAVLILFVLLGVMSLATAPLELAAPRMLIYASVIAGSAIGLSGGAIRATLLRFQVEPDSTVGLSAGFKDAQVTWGYFLANIGALLVFVGAVSIWGRRRDELQAAARRAAQRAAAEASAAEIETARTKAGLS